MNKIIWILLVIGVLVSCKKTILIEKGEGLGDWAEETHCAAFPDYSFFSDDVVRRFDITIEEKWWDLMQKHLEDNYSSSGPGDFSEVTPIYVPCNLEYNGTNWYKVGIRYKGNSSLSTTIGGKLPFRFKFAEFDNDYPEITSQNFYGFEELSLSSNYNDQSVMREKVASDLFRDFGVPCSRSVFCEVYVDFGEGPIYFGLYTVLEVVADSTIKNEFGTDYGNCYKPDGDGASFAKGSFDESYFENKTGGSDFSDVENLYNTIHSSLRTSNPEQWRSEMNSRLNMTDYLKYMAVNFTIQNWDTYGIMTHNYYLYNDPNTSQLNWIPWDNNESFDEGKRGGALSINLSDASDEWPLLSYVINDAVYEEEYKNHLQDFTSNFFNSSMMDERFSAYSSLIGPSVSAETSNYSYLNSYSNFNSAVDELESHVTSRHNAVINYIN